jgi:hypothetical protein
LFGALAPRWMDKVMERTMFASQQSSRPAHGRDASALYHAGQGMKERGSHLGWFRKRSLYVKATTHPVLAAAAVASLGVLFAAIVQRIR